MQISCQIYTHMKQSRSIGDAETRWLQHEVFRLILILSLFILLLASQSGHSSQSGFSAHLDTFPIHPVACFSVETFIPIEFPCIPLTLCSDRVSLHLAGTLVLFENLSRALPSFYKVYLLACRLRTLLLLSLILLQTWLALSLCQMSLALLDKWSYNRPLIFAGLAAATSTPFKKRVRA